MLLLSILSLYHSPVTLFRWSSVNSGALAMIDVFNTQQFKMLESTDENLICIP